MTNSIYVLRHSGLPGKRLIFLQPMRRSSFLNFVFDRKTSLLAFEMAPLRSASPATAEALKKANGGG